MASGWFTDSEVTRLYVYSKFEFVRSRYLSHLWKAPLMLSLPADRFTWRTSPNFSKCKELRNNSRNDNSPLNCKTKLTNIWARLCISNHQADDSSDFPYQCLTNDSNIWKNKASTTFYSSGENVYLVALFGMLILPWRICYNRKKYSKCIIKYSIKRKIANTWLMRSLLKIDREWEYYNREKGLGLYINGEAAEWLSVYQEKLSPLKWPVFEYTLQKASLVIFRTVIVFIFTYFSYN